MVRPSRAAGSYNKTKKVSFCEFGNNSTPSLSEPIANNYIKVRRSVINHMLQMDSRMSRKSPLITSGKV